MQDIMPSHNYDLDILLFMDFCENFRSEMYGSLFCSALQIVVFFTNEE